MAESISSNQVMNKIAPSDIMYLGKHLKLDLPLFKTIIIQSLVSVYFHLFQAITIQI